MPPLARPYVQRALASTGAQLDPSDLEPGGLGGDDFADNYKAWYLDNDDLVLDMPASRRGPTHAGEWEIHVPLVALRSIMPGGGCSG